MHVIDESSPLFGATPESLREDEATILLEIEGVDETTSQPLVAMHQWDVDEVRWNHGHADLVRRDKDGTYVIDYTIFHDVFPLGEKMMRRRGNVFKKRAFGLNNGLNSA